MCIVLPASNLRATRRLFYGLSTSNAIVFPVSANLIKFEIIFDPRRAKYRRLKGTGLSINATPLFWGAYSKKHLLGVVPSGAKNKYYPIQQPSQGLAEKVLVRAGFGLSTGYPQCGIRLAGSIVLCLRCCTARKRSQIAFACENGSGCGGCLGAFWPN